MDRAAANLVEQFGVMNPVLDQVADLNWPGLATAYWGYRGLRYAHDRTNRYLANRRREHQLDNFYNTRSPRTQYLTQDQMPFIGPRRPRRTFVRAPRQSGYVPMARRPRSAPFVPTKPAITGPPKDEIFINVVNMT